MLIRTDNTSTVHYVNCGSGRVGSLSEVAKAIRLWEVEHSVEALAIHLPGEKNLTADALSRMKLHAARRDTCPDRSLRKRLFSEPNNRHGPISIDGMASDSGENAQLSRYYSPSNSYFEQESFEERTWLFPPLDLIGVLLHFLDDKRKQKVH